MDHQSQNVESAIAAILNQLTDDQLTDDQITWAADPARGVFRGYPAPVRHPRCRPPAARERQPRQRRSHRFLQPGDRRCHPPDCPATTGLRRCIHLYAYSR